jgi:hypothetical protein
MARFCYTGISILTLAPAQAALYAQNEKGNADAETYISAQQS